MPSIGLQLEKLLLLVRLPSPGNYPDPLAAEARKVQGTMLKQEQQHRILYVTPSAINRKALQSVFHSAKYTVVYCMNVDHAVAFCIDNGVSAIVLDAAFLKEQDWFAVQT